MPKVPGYSNFQTQIATQPGATVQAPSGPQAGAIAAEQTGQMGRSLLGLGNEVSRIAQIELEQDDKFRVEDAFTQATIAARKLALDPKEGYVNLKGQNALAPDEENNGLEYRYGKKLNDQIEAIGKTLGNENQKRVFAARSAGLRANFEGDILQHLTREDQNYKVSVANGGVETGVQLVADAGTDSKKIQMGLDKIVASVELNPLGKSPEELEGLKIKALSVAHMNVIETSTADGPNQNLQFARDYFAANKATMSPDVRERASKILEVGGFERKTQDGAADIWAQSRGDTAMALKLAREKFDGKEEDAVVQRIKVFQSEASVIDTEAVKALGKSAWSSVMKTGRLDPALLSDMKTKAPEELRQIRDWQDQKRRQAKAEAEGGSASKDGEYYKFRRMAMDNPAEFARLDLSKVEPYLTKGDLRNLIDIQAGLVKGDAKEMESSRVLKSTLGMLKTEVARVGIDLTPKEGTKQAEETANFMDALTRSLDQATREKKAPLTEAEAKRIGMSMVREGIEQGSGIFGFMPNKKKGYQIATDPNIDPKANFIAKPFKEIPQEVRDALFQEAVARRETLTGKPLQRGIYGDRAYVDRADIEKEVERAYTKGVDKGRF